MKSGYTFHTKKKDVLATQVIPGREAEMTENMAGGKAFVADDLTALRRWLLTGSENNLFYQGKEELTIENVKILSCMVAKDPKVVADEIVYASDHGINNHTPLLALVYLSMGGIDAKVYFSQIFNKIVRTASHLYEFLEYTKGLRGFGRLIHTAVEKWITSHDVKGLEYQFLKYQSRYNWAGRDVLRKIKPVPRDATESNLFAWMAGKDFKDDLKIDSNIENGGPLPLINVYEILKRFGSTMKEADVIKAILDFGLTQEMIPANVARTKGVWEALFTKMPITATLRNLANLTNKGIFTNVENLKVLEEKFTKERLMKGRVHPINIVSAYKIYSAGGTLGRSQLTWVAHPVVEDILEKAVEEAFTALEPTNKVFYHAIDVSGSMQNSPLETMWMTPSEVATIMALATIKAEKYYFTSAFTTTTNDFPKLRKTTSFKEALGRGFMPMTPAGTDVGSAIQFAIDNKLKADNLVIWTDGQNWQGKQPVTLMRKYRDTINADAKIIYVVLTPYPDRSSLSDPKDNKSYDIAGFSSETPRFIQMIANGEL
jgi:60 kDa SS-A/Ro ribonucleoprotein